MRVSLRAPWTVPMAAHGILCVALLSQPGLGAPGYLSALATGLVLFFTGPWLGFAGPPPPALRAVGPRILRRTAGAVGIPALIVGFSTLGRPLCAPGRALAFWALGPLFGAAFAILLGTSLRKAFASKPRRGALVLGSLLLASLAYHLFRLYREPAVSFFHPIIGSFAGPVYERHVPLGLPYLLHRLWWLGMVPLLLLPWLRRRRRVLAAAALWLLLGFFLAGPLGVSPGRAEIASQLSAHRHGRLVDLRANPEAYTPRELDLLSEVLDFHAAELVAWLGLGPEAPRITAWLFADEAQKKALMGAGRTEVAKPWLHEVYIGGADADQPVLRHELAHALAAPLAPGPLHIPARAGLWPQMALVEGLATAATWEGGALHPHAWTGLMDELGLRPSMDSLLGPAGFWRTFGPTAYTASASFVAWIRAAFGPEALRRAYAGDPFDEVTGQSLHALEARWRTECLRPALKSLPKAARAVARERFARRPVYQRPCGLELGRLTDAIVTLAGEGKLPEALDRAEALVAATGGDPEVATVEVRAARAAYEPAAILAGVARVEALGAPGGLGPATRAWLALQRADALWWLAAPEASFEALAALDLDLLPRPLARGVAMRRLLLGRVAGHAPFAPACARRSGRGGSAELLDLLSQRPERPRDPMTALLARDRCREDPAAAYLLGFQLEARGLWEEALDAYTAVGLPPGWPALLTREAAYRAGRLATWLHHGPRAETALRRALALEVWPGHRAPILRWLRFLRDTH